MWLQASGFELAHPTWRHGLHGGECVACLDTQAGRAGRDGSQARCVALLDDADFVRLRSLAFSDVLDFEAVRGFLAAVFSPAAEGERRRKQRGQGDTEAETAAKRGTTGRKRKAAEEVASDSDAENQEQTAEVQRTDHCKMHREQDGAALKGKATALPKPHAPEPRRRFGVLAVKKLATELDMREESMESVLSFLEADDQPCVRLLAATALSVKVSFYAVAAEQLALQYPAVQVRVMTFCACVPHARACGLCEQPPCCCSRQARMCLRRLCWRHAPTLATACMPCPPPSSQRWRKRRRAWCCRSCAAWLQAACWGLSCLGTRGWRTR